MLVELNPFAFWDETDVLNMDYREKSNRLWITLGSKKLPSVNTSLGQGRRVSPRPLFIISLPVHRDKMKILLDKARSIVVLTDAILGEAIISLLTPCYGPTSGWLDKYLLYGPREIIRKKLYR